MIGSAKKLLWAAIFACAAALGLVGCGGQQAARPAQNAGYAVIKDDMGREVVLAKKPERIAVTSASFIEPLHLVGGEVVARPDSRTLMPDYAKDKPSIGRVYNIDVEKLLAAAPDLVIINKGMNEKLLNTLTPNNIPAVVLDMKSYASVKRELAIMAQITGQREKGEACIRAMDERIQKTVARVPQERKRVAILHSTAQGLSVQLESSIAGSVAKRLGFINVAAGMKALEDNPDAAPYSMETLVEQNPEIIFITSMGKIDDIKASMAKTIAASPAWQTIPAVKNGQLYYLSQERFLLSPGVHYPEAFEEMARLIYPEAF